MARIQLFEFEDLKWFPAFLRDFGTDFLQFLSNKTKMYKPVIPIIKKGINKSGANQIIDLCSGGGGGLLWLNGELLKTNVNLKIMLTDYFPNIPAFEYTQKQASNITFVKDRIDARNVPENLIGLRTQFLSFHHFAAEDARLILQNAVDSNQPIAIFEAQERSIASLLAMLFSPVVVLLTTPFIRPFKLLRIVFTYIIPLVPLFVLWDGLVSSLRTYSVREMNDLIESLQKKETFDWETGRIKQGPGVVLYMLGTPKK